MTCRYADLRNPKVYLGAPRPGERMQRLPRMGCAGSRGRRFELLRRLIGRKREGAGSHASNRCSGNSEVAGKLRNGFTAFDQAVSASNLGRRTSVA